MRLGETVGIALGCLLALGLTACLVPVRSAPGVAGTVVDQASGEPIRGAHVVVRFDGRYGDQLPDREHLGHAETRTGPDGSFEIPRYTSGGLTIWPLFETEARVVAVMRDGYRCGTPVHVRGDDTVRIALTPALDVEDQRQSCRPVASRRGEAEKYRAAWRALFPAAETAGQREEKRQVERLLRARAALGFGENCEGPVTDLALSPGGRRVAFVAPGSEGPQVQLAELPLAGPGTPKVAATAVDVPPRRLAWTDPGELVLWQPASRADRAFSPSVFAPGRSEVVWTTSRALPASIDRGTPASSKRTSPKRPLEPTDLSDEAETLWLGRSFALESRLDAVSGLAADRLVVTHEDGGRYAIDLPGEACGGPRYGRPQYRIGAEGRWAVDLRFVDGGCHAVAIDLQTGEWTPIDRAGVPGVCRAQRNIPPAQLKTALRGWTQELEAELTAAGADVGATYALRIGRDGSTRVQARDFSGAPLDLEAPRFPVSTPLRRIDVTHVAPHTGGTRANPGALPADLEPL